MTEYSQPTEGLDATPRAGNDSGGGQLGNVLKCKPGGPTDYIYVVVQEAVWNALANRVGGAALVSDPRFAAIGDRRKNQAQMWALLNEFAAGYTKRELMAVLNELDVPCGPVMSTKDLAEDEHVRLREMYVELDHPQRGKWHNVGMPIKLSDSPAKIERSPMLGEHTDEILREVLELPDAQIEAMREAGAFTKDAPKKASEYSPAARLTKETNDGNRQNCRFGRFSTRSKLRGARRSPRPKASWYAMRTESPFRRKVSQPRPLKRRSLLRQWAFRSC